MKFLLLQFVSRFLMKIRMVAWIVMSCTIWLMCCYSYELRAVQLQIILV